MRFHLFHPWRHIPLFRRFFWPSDPHTQRRRMKYCLCLLQLMAKGHNAKWSIEIRNEKERVLLFSFFHLYHFFWFYSFLPVIAFSPIFLALHAIRIAKARTEVGIYTRKQESKKTRTRTRKRSRKQEKKKENKNSTKKAIKKKKESKQELDQESDQDHFLGRVLVFLLFSFFLYSYFLVFFFKFSPQVENNKINFNGK